ncbi:hypothetical protein Taro_045640, partial [Colocasia esculenta]|nr:hypothetical protein [Colocasia esculenta]
LGTNPQGFTRKGITLLVARAQLHYEADQNKRRDKNPPTLLYLEEEGLKVNKRQTTHECTSYRRVRQTQVTKTGSRHQPQTRTNNTSTPLSLAATDERSSCRSTSAAAPPQQDKNCGDKPHHTCKQHCCKTRPDTFRDSGREP